MENLSFLGVPILKHITISYGLHYAIKNINEIQKY